MNTIYKHPSGDWSSIVWRNLQIKLDEPRRLPVAAAMYSAKVRLDIESDDRPSHREEFTMAFVLAVPDDWTAGCGVVQTGCRQHGPFRSPILALQVAFQEGLITQEQYNAASREVLANATRKEIEHQTNGKQKGSN
jgi:hypothetical protein